MPLLLAGQPYEWPRRKPVDALNSFTESILAARKQSANKKLVGLESREVKNLNGADVDTLVVVQREYATLAGTGNSKVRDNTIGMPTKIASVDATTCLIIALTNPGTGDTAMAHIDSEKQVDKGIADMLKTLGVASLDCKSVPPNTVLPEDRPIPVVRVAMLGCVVYHEYSPVTLTALLKKFTATNDVHFDIGCGFDVAVWNLNWDAENKKILRRGLMIDLAKNNEGELSVVECQNELRAYPDVRLRSLRSFAKDPHLSSITLFKGEEAAMKITQKESKVQEITSAEQEAAIAKEKTAAAPATVPRAIFKMVIRPFEWPAMLQDAAKKPLEWFYQLSSTPDMEPEDFAHSVKQAVIFGNIFPSHQVFKLNRPRLYMASAEEKKWVELAGAQQ